MLGNSGIWAQDRKICTCLGSLRMGDVRFFFGGCRNDSGQN